MREVKRKSALPVYIAAGVFAVYALIFPMYKFWHLLIAALVTAAAWLIGDKLVKPVTEYVAEPEPEPEPEVSHGEAIDAILAEAKKAHAEMSRLASSIGDPDIAERIEKLASLSDRIAADAIEDPSDVRQIRKFQSYFLPSTIGLLNAYDRMSAEGIEGDNLTATKARISEMLDTEITAFEKQLDALYANDSMSIDADIQVMQKLLEREGLLGSDELHELIKNAEAAQHAEEPVAFAAEQPAAEPVELPTVDKASLDDQFREIWARAQAGQAAAGEEPPEQVSAVQGSAN